MTNYSHQQIGKTIIVAFGIATLLILWAWFTTDFGTGGWLALTFLVIVATLFASLTIEVSSEQLHWKFGPGLIRKSVPLSEINTAEVTRSRWWEGWGIRLTRRGWLYNVSGLDAVAIQLHSGKRFLLGTDEPDRLVQALDRARSNIR